MICRFLGFSRKFLKLKEQTTDFCKYFLSFSLEFTLIAAFSSPISSILSKFPDKYLATGKLDQVQSPVRVFLGNSSDPAKFPEELPRLRELSMQAPVGKGDKTTIDTNVRKVLQTDQCKIEWNVKPALEEIARQLSLPLHSLTASFYKLLYYTKDDFFLDHYDT